MTEEPGLQGPLAPPQEVGQQIVVTVNDDPLLSTATTSTTADEKQPLLAAAPKTKKPQPTKKKGPKGQRIPPPPPVDIIEPVDNSTLRTDCRVAFYPVVWHCFWALLTAVACAVVSVTIRMRGLSALLSPGALLELISEGLLALFCIVAIIFASVLRRTEPHTLSSILLGMAVVLVATAVVSVGALAMTISDYLKSFIHEPCEEREPSQWNGFSFTCLRGGLCVSVLFATLTTLSPLFKYPKTIEKENQVYLKKPHNPVLHFITHLMTCCINACFMPRDTMSMPISEAHVVHHVFQLIYEIIILIFSIIKENYVGILAIGAGLCASALATCASFAPQKQSSVAPWWSKVMFIRADLLFNVFAVGISLFTMPLEIGHLACTHSTNLRVAVDVVALAIGADTIRLNSIAHSVLEHGEAMWVWLFQEAYGGRLPPEFMVEKHKEEAEKNKPKPSHATLEKLKKQQQEAKFARNVRNGTFTKQIVICGLCIIGLTVATLMVGLLWSKPDIEAANHAPQLDCVVKEIISFGVCSRSYQISYTVSLLFPDSNRTCVASTGCQSSIHLSTGDKIACYVDTRKSADQCPSPSEPAMGFWPLFGLIISGLLWAVAVLVFLIFLCAIPKARRILKEYQSINN